MAEDGKVPTVEDGLATGVQSVGGVPVLMKEEVPVAVTSAEVDVDAAKEKERVLAAFHSAAPEAVTKSVSETAPEGESKQIGLATGVQSVGGVPVLAKQVASSEKNGDTSDAAKEKERVLAAFHSDKPPAEAAPIPPAENESAPIEVTGDGEPVSKAGKKGTIFGLKDRVALAFKSEPKPEKDGEKGTEEETMGKEGGKLGAPTLKSRVYQSVGSIGDKVKSQASSLRASWKSENKVGVDEKDASSEAVSLEGEPVKVSSAELQEANTAGPSSDLPSPGAEKTTVKDRVIQRVGSLTEKMKQQADYVKSAWKPEDKKPVAAEDLKDDPESSKAEASPEPAVEPAASYEYGKGRVAVFSISGCPHCKAAKALLKKKGVKFAEVNLDVFPERREEMQERTGKSSCPQIFFNDKLIGGNDALQALENEGKLDAELKLVHETLVPSSAPATPGPSKSAAPVADEALDKHLETVKWLREKLAIKDRWYKLRKYDRCFVGSQAVDLVVEEKKISRQEATSLLQQLQTKHFFHHVLREHPFKDGPLFYRLLEHEPFVKTSANWSGATSDLEPPPAVELGTRMRKLILAVYDEFLSDDGRHVDYRGIAKSEIFRRYVRLTLQLQRVDVLALSREEKLAFFINIYNALVIHVTVVLGHGPTTLAVRRHFFTEHTYIIGGSSYSLTAIENGVLRGNKRPPFFFSKPFGDKDDRLPVALTTPEPLIHFALVCGAKSCPPVKTYEAKAVDESLKAAAQGFFEGGGASIDVETKTIHLSKILSWYKTDFGATDLEVLKFVARFLTLKERDKLEALIGEGKYKIEYQPYDWSANSAE